MKKGFTNILITCLVIVLVSSCKKSPLNDSIEQQWQLKRYTLIENNKVIECERLFYCITRMVTVVVEKQGKNNYGEYIAKTFYNKDKTELILQDFKVREDSGDTGIDATPEQLKPFGIINPKETIFHIVISSHKKLVLESKYAKLEFYKF